jgi:hypothetical protein
MTAAAVAADQAAAIKASVRAEIANELSGMVAVQRRDVVVSETLAGM